MLKYDRGVEETTLNKVPERQLVVAYDLLNKTVKFIKRSVSLVM